QSQTPVAKHRHPLSAVDLYLLKHLKRRRQRLNENGGVIIHRFGQHVQIDRWKPHKLGESAIMFQNPKNRTIAAMVAEARQAQVTSATDNIDFATDALAGEIFV